MSPEASSENQSSITRVVDWLRASRPRLVTLGIALLLIQALAVGIYTIDGLIQLVLGRMEHVSVGISLLLFTGFLTWFLVVLARGMGNRKAWTRGPAVTIQIFVVLVGVSLVQGSFWFAGIGVILFGLLTGFTLVAPSSVQYVGTREMRED